MIEEHHVRAQYGDVDIVLANKRDQTLDQQVNVLQQPLLVNVTCIPSKMIRESAVHLHRDHRCAPLRSKKTKAMHQ